MSIADRLTAISQLSPDPGVAAVQRELLNYLETVKIEMPRDEGAKRLLVSIAFLCGAAVVAELHQTGSGRPYADYAATLKTRREAWLDPLAAFTRPPS